MKLDKLKQQIEQWAIDRGLQNGDPKYQVLKLIEEVGELASGMNKSDHPLVLDSIGDIFVVLVVLSTQLEIDITDCINYAYEEIKHRKGKMVNGVFVKEADMKTMVTNGDVEL